MLTYSKRSIFVFQSPISKCFVRAPAPSSDDLVFDCDLSFFAFLFERVREPDQFFLSPHALVHLWAPFRNFTAPEYCRALYWFLMECRANYLTADFIHEIKNRPLPQRLQVLMFLFVEYMLFKAQNPGARDPWDVIVRAAEHGADAADGAPLHWIRDAGASTWHTRVSELFLEQCGARIIRPKNARGRVKEMPNDRLIPLIRRARGVNFILAPEHASLIPAFHLSGLPPRVFATAAAGLAAFDDVYGFARDHCPAAPPPSAYLCPADFRERVWEDHVAPPELTDHPLWRACAGLPRRPEALIAETHLWTSAIASAIAPPAQTSEDDAADFENAVMIHVRPPWMPSDRDLRFVQNNIAHLTISPDCVYHGGITPTTLSVVPSPEAERAL